MASAVSFLVHPLPDDHGSLGEAGTMHSSCVSLRMLWKNFLSFAPALFELGIWCIFPLTLHLVLLSSTENWILRVFVGAILGSTVDTCSATVLLVAMDELHTFSALRRTRILKCCSPFCCRTEKRAQSMLLVAVLLCVVRTWKTGSTSRASRG